MRDDRNDKPSRDKMSWSEIDKIRDKSRERERDPMQKQSSPMAMQAQKSYKAALERAFAAGTLGELAKTLARTVDEIRPGQAAGTKPAATHTKVEDDSKPTPAPLPPATATAPNPERENRLKLLAKIKQSEGRDPISRAVDGYLAKYPKLPDDYEVLTKALSHNDDERVQQVLDQLTAMLAKEKPRRGRTLAAQLRFLEDTHDEPSIRKHAAEVRTRL